MRSQFDVICVGTGFSTSFFLHKFLARQAAGTRVLVLEAGHKVSHADQLAEARGSKHHPDVAAAPGE